jgi:hypothetical protein
MKRSHCLRPLVTVLAGLSIAGSAWADDSILNLPPPDSAENLPSIFDLGTAGIEEPSAPLKDFLEASTLKLKLRNYYLNRDRPSSADSSAWAQGGSVEYSTGKIAGVFSATFEQFGSFKLWAPDQYTGTLLLEPDQDNINVLGVANARIDLEGNIISVFRQKYDLPYLNQQDNRMIPNTFEGYTIAMPKTSNDRFQYVLGFVDKIKKRDSDTFVSMSDAAGITAHESGLFMAGGRFFPIPEWSVAAIDLYTKDILNYFYTETIYKRKYTEDFANNLSLQFSTQNTVGDDLLTGDSYNSFFWGIQDAVSYRHAVLKAAVNQTDTGATMRSFYGSYPGYTSSIVEDFNRAGETSWLVGLSYDFGRLGLKDLSLSSNYISGSGAVDEITKLDIADKTETDVTLDYKVSDGLLKGFWIRLRSATITEEHKPNTQDYRVIVNYEIPLYQPPEADKKKS